MSNLIKIDKEYKNWISDVSKRFRKSQLKAAVKVNEEMLRFYWTMGRDIAKMSNEAKYGSQFYNTISTDLKDIFPDIKSFSPTNLKYMRYFYEMYPTAEICQKVVDESETIVSSLLTNLGYNGFFAFHGDIICFFLINARKIRKKLCFM